jgi:hypothetical protein
MLSAARKCGPQIGAPVIKFSRPPEMTSMPAAPMVIVEIWDPGLERRGQAVAYANSCLAKVQEALTHSGGLISNGVIQGISAAGVPHSELATWTFLPGPATGP